jgi:hypothetical protein
VAKRVDVKIRRGRVSSVGGYSVERFSEVPNSPKLHAWNTKEFAVGRRFLCFVSLSLFDKEMKSRHGQWLIVIKRTTRIERLKKQKSATGN